MQNIQLSAVKKWQLNRIAQNAISMTGIGLKRLLLGRYIEIYSHFFRRRRLVLQSTAIL